MVGASLSCYSFSSLLFLCPFFTVCYFFVYVSDYIFEKMENNVDEDKEDHEVRRQGRGVIRMQA